MNNQNDRKEFVDIKYLFFKLKSKWYLFAVFVLGALFLAYVKNQTADPIYEVDATVLFENQSSGSRRAEELLSAMNIKQDRGIKIEDEIGVLTSYAMVKQAMQLLDFEVSYHVVPDTWLNAFTPAIVREQYKSAPYEVTLNPNGNQLIGAPIYVRFLSKNRCEISIDAKDVQVYNLKTEEVVDIIPSVNYSKVIDINEPFSSKILNLRITVNDFEAIKPAEKYFFKIHSIDNLAKSYQKKLSAKPIDHESRIVRVTSTGPVIQKEKQFLSTLVNLLIEKDLENKNQTGLSTINFIDNQLSVISDSLDQAETALETYRTANKIMDISYASSNVFEKLDRLEQERAENSIRLEYYKNTLRYLQSDKDVAEVVSPTAVGINDPVLSGLILDLNKLYQQKASLNYSSRKENPALESLNFQIESTKSSLIENLKNLIGSVDISMNHLNRRIAEIENNVSRLPQNERRLIELQRRFEFNDKTYNFLLEKRAEAALSLATNTADKEVVDTPAYSDQIAPNSKFNYIIALLLGLAIPVGFILAKDFLNDTISSKEDLNKHSKVPLLGVIAHGARKDKVVGFERRNSVVAESFASIRLNLQYFIIGKDKKVITVTSTVSGEGKTYCSVNLAIELALAGYKTVLIGADLRKPRFHEYFKVNNEFGLSAFLAGRCNLNEAIQRTPSQRLDVIPPGPIPPNPIQLIETPKMPSLVDTLKGVYDYIIFDTPPIGFVSEFLILNTLSDLNLYVVRHNYTKIRSIDTINELYEDKKIKNLSVILNDVDFGSSYEYSYKKGYYYKKPSRPEFTVKLDKGRKKRVLNQ